MKLIVAIPARSGSKSIKNKNILIYKKKPLIYHSISLALKSKLVDRVIVSTDSKKYQKLSINFGAEAPFLRPKKYSRDKSNDSEWIYHLINYLKKNENYIPDYIIHLRATSPNRNIKIFEKGISHFLKNKNYATSMRSVSIFSQPPEKFFWKKGEFLMGYFDNKLKGEYHSRARQDYKQAYLPNGYIDILNVNFLLQKRGIYGNKILSYITERTMDIDTLDDIE